MHWNTLTVALLAGAGQGLLFAGLLLRVPANRAANRSLALLLLALALYVTPYIIGYAGAYDRWPQLGFAPFNMSVAFGPMLYLYLLHLTGGRLGPHWFLHFLPSGAQFLSQALVLPFSVADKRWWGSHVHDPYVDPMFRVIAFASVAYYGWRSWRRYKNYRAWLAANRADGDRFDPTWIRNALIALGFVSMLWLAFSIAEAAATHWNYFDNFWRYAAFAALSAYLGVEGWRHAAAPFPAMQVAAPAAAAAMQSPPAADSTGAAGRRWVSQGDEWAAEIDRRGLWRDPDISLASMAQTLGVNTTYLSRALNEGLGVSFHDFVNGRRVEALKRLLADADETRDLLTLALEVGFSSKASFNRIFVKTVGMTPSAYRSKMRPGG